MKFNFTDKKNIQVTEELREYAERKIGKLDKFFKSESEAFVTFATERGRYIAEVTIKNNGIFYRVADTTNDMFASVDSAVAAIERQIRKNKTRLGKKIRAGSLDRDRSSAIVHDIGEEEEQQEFKIV